MHTQNHSISFAKTQIQGHIRMVFYQGYTGEESVKKIQTNPQARRDWSALKNVGRARGVRGREDHH